LSSLSSTIRTTGSISLSHREYALWQVSSSFGLYAIQGFGGFRKTPAYSGGADSRWHRRRGHASVRISRYVLIPPPGTEGPLHRHAPEPCWRQRTAGKGHLRSYAVSPATGCIAPSAVIHTLTTKQRSTKPCRLSPIEKPAAQWCEYSGARCHVFGMFRATSRLLGRMIVAEDG